MANDGNPFGQLVELESTRSFAAAGVISVTVRKRSRRNVTAIVARCTSCVTRQLSSAVRVESAAHFVDFVLFAGRVMKYEGQKPVVPQAQSQGGFP